LGNRVVERSDLVPRSGNFIYLFRQFSGNTYTLPFSHNTCVYRPKTYINLCHWYGRPKINRRSSADIKRNFHLDVATDLHELMIPKRTMRLRLSTLASNWTRGAASRHNTTQLATPGLHAVVDATHNLLIISHSVKDRRLS